MTCTLAVSPATGGMRAIHPSHVLLQLVTCFQGM